MTKYLYFVHWQTKHAMSLCKTLYLDGNEGVYALAWLVILSKTTKHSHCFDCHCQYHHDDHHCHCHHDQWELWTVWCQELNWECLVMTTHVTRQEQVPSILELHWVFYHHSNILVGKINHIDYWGYWAFPRNCKPINPLILQVRLKQSRYPDRLNTKVEYHQQCTYVWLIQGSTTTTTMYPDSVVLYICRGHYTQTTTKAYFSIILRSFLRCKQFRSFQLAGTCALAMQLAEIYQEKGLDSLEFLLNILLLLD